MLRQTRIQIIMIIRTTIITLLLMTTSSSTFAQPGNVETLMDELCQLSNDYSGVLNPRQTWRVSYEGCQIRDEYYFDDELTLVVKINLANMDTVRVEERFVNSIAVYPKDDNARYIDAIRYEKGVAQKITDGVYYNLMLVPDLKGKARAMMQQAIEKCKPGN